jgi:hypothetical protein
MKYMMMLYSEEEVGAISPETFASWIEFRREAAKIARWLAGDALRPASKATVVCVRNGKTVVTDGPFSDTKEHLGGYSIFDCEDRDAALKIASMLPRTFKGRVEVRPIVEFEWQA